MNFNVYSIRDKVGTWTPPTLDANDSIAIRNFAFGINNRPDSMLKFSLDDFSLYRIGTFDSDSAAMTSYAPVFEFS